ncbi:hypothetical protein [Tuwongella immobilis]|uniref:Zinc-finger domain-containing protein n=1 Tax=Tuwongella immobilis TaxID=692036 RepID=A0A6C2YLS8_9BACT|nr:hypothetical protein [Tuwongella immobilis]VIP01872.1 unnamed protein product [Tuwongella immobilis]VTR99704.1 unnamed protein product [Tuwongella immobilis]
MKCTSVRNRLLMTSHPREPSESLRVHLDHCSSCRAFWQGLLKLDAAIPELPVPRGPSGAKARLIAQFEAEAMTAEAAPSASPAAVTFEPQVTLPIPVETKSPAPATIHPATIPPAPLPKSPQASPAKKSKRAVAQVDMPSELPPMSPISSASRHQPRTNHRKERAVLMGGLAASLIVAVGATVFLIQQRPTTTANRTIASPDLFLARIFERNVALAAAETPQRRFDQLVQLSELLWGEGRQLAQVAEAADIAAIAEMYEKVLLDGVLTQARELPEPDRHLIRRVATQLSESSKVAEQLAGQVKPSSVEPLRAIARAASTADKALRAMVREDV